jgi:hypothetical protein
LGGEGPVTEVNADRVAHPALESSSYPGWIGDCASVSGVTDNELSVISHSDHGGYGVGTTAKR